MATALGQGAIQPEFQRHSLPQLDRLLQGATTHGASIGQLETNASIPSRLAWSSCSGLGSRLGTGAQRGRDAGSASANLQARGVGGANPWDGGQTEDCRQQRLGALEDLQAGWKD